MCVNVLPMNGIPWRKGEVVLTCRLQYTYICKLAYCKASR